jgi:hypothetical protein
MLQNLHLTKDHSTIPILNKGYYASIIFNRLYTIVTIFPNLKKYISNYTTFLRTTQLLTIGEQSHA